MQMRSPLPRLVDIIEAIERVQSVLGGCDLAQFEADWQKQWLAVRGVEIVSEASRHLPDDTKSRHPEIPRRRVAGIGNVLRHNYESVAPAVIWKLVRVDLPELLRVCRAERNLVESGSGA